MKLTLNDIRITQKGWIGTSLTHGFLSNIIDTFEAYEAELKSLRPPEPKFKIGQIVIYKLPNNKEQSFTIRHMRFDYDRRSYYYANARAIVNIDWILEDKFRKLTTEEIG